MTVALEIFFVIGVAAQAFPAELDAGQLFIVESRNAELKLAASSEINRIAHGQRSLLAKEARQYFFGFRMVFELCFHMSLSTETAGKRAMADMVHNRNRLLQDGFQIIGQILLGILKQCRFQAYDRSFGRTEPAPIILVGFYG